MIKNDSNIFFQILNEITLSSKKLINIDTGVCLPKRLH